MKKRLCLIASAIIAGTSFSQTSISLKDSSYYYSTWNDASNDWDYLTRNQYSYNSSYDEISDFSSQRTGTGWQNFRNKKNYVYNANHKLLEVTYEKWTGSWADDAKDICTYNASGNILSKLQQSLIGSSWVNTHNSLYTYTGNNLTTALVQFWNMTSASWTNMSRTTYTYNTGDQLTDAVNEDWIAGAWQNSTKLTNHIYSGVDLISHEILAWDVTTSTFNPLQKTNFTYNAAHDVTNAAILYWNNATASWGNIMKIDYTYDAHRNKLTEISMIWDAGSATWKNDTKTLNYYTTGTVGVYEPADRSDIRVYPNPATESITVSIPGSEASTLIITDLSGKTVLSNEPEKADHLSIDLHALEPGIYFMELKHEQGSVRAKFIKH